MRRLFKMKLALPRMPRDRDTHGTTTRQAREDEMEEREEEIQKTLSFLPCSIFHPSVARSRF